MPDRCQVVALSPFVRGLISRAMDVPADYDPDSHAGAVIALILHGEHVTTVAIALGYDNPAAFTSMFKRALGSSPRRYHSDAVIPPST